MFPMDSIEQFKKVYETDGGLSDGGLWSFLLSQSARESADFARRYYDLFNQVARENWHLIIFAKAERANDKTKWSEDGDFQLFGDVIRKGLEDSGERVPSHCIVFFDPEGGKHSGQPCTLIPVDWEMISHDEIFKRVFTEAHSIILSSFEKRGLSAYHKIPPSQVAGLLKEVDAGLRKKKIISFFTSLSFAVGNALLGAVVGRAIER